MAIGLGWWWNTPPFARLEWTWGGLAAGTVATAPLLVGLWWCLRTRWLPVARLMAVVRERIAPMFAGAALVELAALAVLAGVGEEALFRGVVQQALDRQLPGWAALVCTAILFGAVHWLSPAYALLAGLVGLFLGVLYVVSDNLLAPIVTHALYDLVALVVLARMKPAPSPSVV